MDKNLIEEWTKVFISLFTDVAEQDTDEKKFIEEMFLERCTSITELEADWKNMKVIFQ